MNIFELLEPTNCYFYRIPRKNLDLILILKHLEKNYLKHDYLMLLYYQQIICFKYNNNYIVKFESCCNFAQKVAR